jgi:phage-related tail fiber protein
MADQLDGKQIKSASVPDATLATSYIKTDGTRALTGTLAGVTPVGSSDLTTKSYVDALFQGKGMKDPVRLATTGANITLSGNQSIDGVTTATNDRVLVKDQSTASGNGIYLAAAGAWTRAVDFDISAEAVPGCIIPVAEGAVNAETAWELSTDAPITLGSTALVFTYYAGIKVPTLTTSNKEMAASLTTADFQVACATTLVAAPARGGHIGVLVNGRQTVVGNGVKTKSCYFSADSGTTAKTFANLAAGDTLYWVGSVAGYQLATTDLIDFNYEVSQ